MTWMVEKRKLLYGKRKGSGILLFKNRKRREGIPTKKVRKKSAAVKRSGIFIGEAGLQSRTPKQQTWPFHLDRCSTQRHRGLVGCILKVEK